MAKGGTPKIEVTQYYMSQHFGVCTGPIDALKKLIIKEKDAWIGSQSELGTIPINEPELFGGLKKEGGLGGTVHYLPGESDQVLPDALAQKLGRANGADCPGFRGLFSLFFVGDTRPGFYWTANTPYLPGVWATLQRIYKQSDGSEQWYPEKAGIPTGFVISEPATDIAFVGQQQVTRSGSVSGPVTFSLSDGIASTPAAGDLVIITVSSARYPLNTSTYHSEIDGYEPLNDVFNAENLTSDFTFRAYYKRMGDTPDTSFTPEQVMESTARQAIQVMVFRGVNEAVLASEIGRISGVGPANYEPADIVIGQTTFDPGDIGGDVAGQKYVFDSFALLSATGAKAMPVVLGGQSLGGGGAENAGNMLEIFEVTIGSGGNAGRSARATAIYGEPIEIVDVLDMNPAHIIRECLTDTNWGMGTPEAALDGDSFTEAADTLYDELFGLSMMWTRQAEIQAFVQEVLDHIQGVLFVDPATGLLTLKLIRGDYDEETLPELTPDNADLTNFGRKLWGDIVNEIIVTWTNRENEQEETITVQDDASIAIQGGIVSDSRNYYGVRRPALAKDLAMRDLRSAGQPLASCDAELDRTQWELRPASVVKLTWPEYGLSEVVMRVTSIDYGKPGDPTIKVSLVEDVYGLDIGTYDDPPSSEWEDPSAQPTPLDPVEILTLPLFAAANSTIAAFHSDPEYPEVLAGILATSSNEDAFAYELWDEVALPNGTLEWRSLAVNNIIGRALLTSELALTDVSTGVTFGSVTGLTSPAVGGFVIIGEDGEPGNEIAMFEAVGSTYTITRGVLDTVPREWPVGTPAWFINTDTLYEDPTIRSAGETVSYKLRARTSQGLLPLADAPLESYELSDRPWLPNRPADVRAHGEQWSAEDNLIDATDRADPWVTVTWANRNRLLEDSQVLAWTDATVTPETGQTTTIEVRKVDGTLLVTHDGLSGTSFDVPDASFGTENVVRLRVYSERSDADGDFVSLQYFEHWVQVDTGFLLLSGDASDGDDYVLLSDPLSADSTEITADSTEITADATTLGGRIILSGAN